MVADRAGDDHRVARPQLPRRETGVLEKAYARGVDIDPVAAAALDDLGVAGDDLDAGGLRRTGHRIHDARELFRFKAFFDHNGAA